MNELEQAILKNHLTLDCPIITLSKQVSDSNNNDLHKGAGFISQVEDGQFLLKLYSDKSYPINKFLSQSGSKAGELIKESEYFSLSAFDLYGRNWTTDRLLITIHSSNNKGYLITSKIRELQYKHELHKPLDFSFLKIRFRNNIDFPCNIITKNQKIVDGEEISGAYKRNVVKFDSCGFNFEIHKQKIGVEIKVYSKSISINEAIIVRITEAFQFIFGTTLSWATLEITQGQKSIVKIKPPHMGKDISRVFPPLTLTYHAEHNDIWKLFDKYLKHVISFNKNTWHPLFMRIHSVIESGNASFEAKALTISVSIEGILKSEFFKVFEIDENFKKQINRAKELFKKCPDLSSEFQKRLEGSLGNMRNPRAKDRLLILKEKGLIENKFIIAWDKLRNSSAHADSANWEDLQTFLDRYSTVLVLFYQLIFLSIKYTGKYSDYSTYDFPIKDFNKKIA